jgi:hypothetical protein
LLSVFHFAKDIIVTAVVLLQKSLEHSVGVVLLYCYLYLILERLVVKDSLLIRGGVVRGELAKIIHIVILFVGVDSAEILLRNVHNLFIQPLLFLACEIRLKLMVPDSLLH